MFVKTSQILMVLGIVWFAAESDLQAAGWTKTVAASDKTSLDVVLRSGDINITGWDRKEAKLESNSKEGFIVKADGDTIKVESDKSKESFFSASEGDLKLQVPKGASISLVTISGDVHIQSMTGRCRVKCVSGDVQVFGCKGPVDIKTVSGNVTAKNIQSSFSAKTVSGDLDAAEIKGSLLEAKSVSGNIEFNKTDVQQGRINSLSGEIRFVGSIGSKGSLEAKSFSGDMVVKLPAGSGFQVNAKTKSGDVKVGFSMDQVQKEENKVKGRVGRGGAELKLKSFSGDIEVTPK